MTTLQDASGRSHVSVTAQADCPFSIAHDYAQDYFQSAGSNQPRITVRVPLPEPLPALRRTVPLRFALHMDDSEPGREHDEIRLQWTAKSAFLPDFRGTLRFRIRGAKTLVLIDGSYRPPLGTFGRWCDAIAGNRIARATLNDFARRIAAYLAGRQHLWRQTLATPAGAGSPT